MATDQPKPPTKPRTKVVSIKDLDRYLAGDESADQAPAAPPSEETTQAYLDGLDSTDNARRELKQRAEDNKALQAPSKDWKVGDAKQTQDHPFLGRDYEVEAELPGVGKVTKTYAGEAAFDPNVVFEDSTELSVEGEEYAAPAQALFLEQATPREGSEPVDWELKAPSRAASGSPGEVEPPDETEPRRATGPKPGEGAWQGAGNYTYEQGPDGAVRIWHNGEYKGAVKSGSAYDAIMAEKAGQVPSEGPVTEADFEGVDTSDVSSFVPSDSTPEEFETTDLDPLMGETDIEGGTPDTMTWEDIHNLFPEIPRSRVPFVAAAHNIQQDRLGRNPDSGRAGRAIAYVPGFDSLYNSLEDLFSSGE